MNQNPSSRPHYPARSPLPRHFVGRLANALVRNGVVGAAICVMFCVCTRIDAAPVGVQHLRGVILPCYGTNRAEALAVIRVDRVHPDHERRGFFKIGLLPVVVADTVEIQIHSRDAMPVLGGLLATNLHDFTGGVPLVCRKVTFRKGTDGKPFLRARELTVRRGSRQVLLEDVLLRETNGFVPISRAILDVTSPWDPRLIWGPQQHCHLARAFLPGSQPKPD